MSSTIDFYCDWGRVIAINPLNCKPLGCSSATKSAGDIDVLVQGPNDHLDITYVNCPEGIYFCLWMGVGP